jgi:RNA polymerase sigma-70 factor (ECF subfamily)
MNLREDDRSLVARARQGDAGAIGALFSRYWRAARAAAFGVTGELASAEDAAAEAFRQAWIGLDSLRDADRFGPWLRTIVVRRARQSRPGGAVPDPPVHEAPDTTELPDSVMERLEMAALVQRLVRALPARLREAVSLFYFEGYDSDQAARFLEIPGSTLRRRLLEGRRHLRREIDRVLKGRTSMNQERLREIERLKGLLEQADSGASEPLYQVLRGSLALRPVPQELIGALFQRVHSSAAAAPETGGEGEFGSRVRETARLFTTPSDRSRDPDHPVGRVAAQIRRALPEFQDWALDAGEAAAQLIGVAGQQRGHPRAVLPPGFDEGRPGAFIRATRGLVFPGESGADRTTYQLLKDSESQQVFRAGINNVRISDVLDLTWMVEGALELRTVQQRLERLSADVLPGVTIRFAPYEEPRYRFALQLHLGDHPAAAARGGVLAEWPGRAAHVEAAHVRIFLEPWAAMQSGETVELDRAPRPAMPDTRSRNDD